MPSRTPMADLPMNVLREALLTHTTTQLAQRYGTHDLTVWQWRHRLLPQTQRRVRHAPRRQQVVRLLARHPEGLRCCEIVHAMPGTTRQSLAQVLAAAARWHEVTRQGRRWFAVQVEMTL